MCVGTAYVLSRLCGAPYVPSRLSLMRRAAYMPGRVCTEPAYVLSRLAAVYLRSAVRGTPPMCGGRYMLGRL
jgi:hypothetical protein